MKRYTRGVVWMAAGPVLISGGLLVGLVGLLLWRLA